MLHFAIWQVSGYQSPESEFPFSSASQSTCCFSLYKTHSVRVCGLFPGLQPSCMNEKCSSVTHLHPNTCTNSIVKPSFLGNLLFLMYSYTNELSLSKFKIMQNPSSGKCLKMVMTDVIWLTFYPLFETFAQLPGYWHFPASTFASSSNDQSWKTSFAFLHLTEIEMTLLLQEEGNKRRDKKISQVGWEK